jgi:hypothetical protein
MCSKRPRVGQGGPCSTHAKRSKTTKEAVFGLFQRSDWSVVFLLLVLGWSEGRLKREADQAP